MSSRSLSIVAAALALVAAAVYPEILFGISTFALRDHPVLTVPARAFLHDALLGGRFPGWWDRVGFGVPFAANPVYQAVAPVASLFSLLPQPYGADVEQLAYIWLFALGTALFSSRLGARAGGAFVAGALAASGGYFGSLIFNGGIPYITWLPWIAWATDRLAAADGRRNRARAAAVLSIFGALQLLGPDPAILTTAAFLAAFVLLLRSDGERLSKAGWLMGAGAVSMALAGVGLVPAIAFARHSARADGFPLDTAQVWSLHPWRLVELVWPGVLGDANTIRNDLGWVIANAAGEAGVERSWSYTVFIGVPTLILAAFGAERGRNRRLLLTATFFLALALGKYTPLYGILRDAFPPERYFRYPEKHVTAAMLLAWAFAGVGWTRLSRGGSRAFAWALAAATLVLAVAVATLALLAPSLVTPLTERVSLAHLEFVLDPAAALSYSVRQGAVTVVLLAVATLGAFLARRRGLAGAAVVAAAALAASWRDARTATPLAPSQVKRPDVLAAVPAGTRMYRDFGAIRDSTGGAASAAREYETLAGNVASRFGIGTVPGFDPAPTAAYEELWQSLFNDMTMESVASLLGLRWSLVYDMASPWALTRPAVARANKFSLIDYPAVRPHAFVTPFAVSAATQDDALGTLVLQDRNPAAVAIEGPTPGARAGLLAPCGVASPQPERVELACASEGGWAVLLDAAAPGWSATVDGGPAEIRRADGLFRAVEIPPGLHRVTFSYETPGLLLGIALSGAAVSLLLVVARLTRTPRAADG